MSLTDTLLIRARAAALHEGVPLSTISWRLFKDNKVLDNIEAGSTITVRRCEGALETLEAWASAADATA